MRNQSDAGAQKPLPETRKSHQTTIEAPKNATTNRPKPIKTTNSANFKTLLSLLANSTRERERENKFNIQDHDEHFQRK